MKLDTTTRYGFRLVANLAMEDGIKSLSQIAVEEKISRKYLEQIILKLRKKNILKGFKGTKGGYILSKPANEISLLQVYRALEGREHIIYCLNSKESCKKSKTCKTIKLWRCLDQSLNNLLDRHSVADLVNEIIKLK